MPSPPIEVVWFYTAVNFHTHKSSTAKDDKLGIILGLKELFHLLVSCSGPCSSSLKRVAVLAPLVFELYSFVSELKLQTGFSSDNVVVEREIVCLVERLVSFISLCCCEGVDEHDDSLALSPCFVDLVNVWTVRRRGRDFKFEDDFRIFFPIISDEVRNGLFVGAGVGVLAGIVMCQTFLLSLSLKFGLEEPSKKLEEDVLNSAVNTITGFRSCYFFDTLLKVLLDSSLPITSLITATYEVLLREVLFDAVVLVDYPFFNPECRICSLHLNGLASIWLFVADKAMQFVRNNGDQTRLITYTKAFSKSLINSQLLRWVSNQVGIVEDANRPNLSTPAAFVEWLVQLRSQVSAGFDNEFIMLLEKATHYKSEMIHIDQKLDEGGGKAHCQMVDSPDAANFGCDPDFAAIDGCRKRKGGIDEGSIRVKLLKYRTHGNPIKNFSSFQNEVTFDSARQEEASGTC